MSFEGTVFFYLVRWIIYLFLIHSKPLFLVTAICFSTAHNFRRSKWTKILILVSKSQFHLFSAHLSLSILAWVLLFLVEPWSDAAGHKTSQAELSRASAECQVSLTTKLVFKIIVVEKYCGIIKTRISLCTKYFRMTYKHSKMTTTKKKYFFFFLLKVV